MDNTCIERWIKEFIKTYPDKKRVETIWREPIVGFASAHDPLFPQFKKIVHPNHALPQDLLGGAQSVVVHYIPFGTSIHRENYSEKFYSARSWAMAYLETNQLITETNLFLKERFESHGYRVSLIPPTHNFDQESLMSDWSHRHMAYLAGIGKFGRHNLFITEKGCTGRLGSFVTNLRLEPTPFSTQEFCLDKAGFKCLKCIERCVYGALSLDSYDRHRCNEQCLENDRHHEDLGLVDVCGKCAALVPCSVINPVRKSHKRK